MNKKTLLNIIVAILLLVFIFNAGMLGKWIFVGLIACAAIRILVYIGTLYARYLRNRSSFQREYSLKMTAWMMGYFFLTGTILFMLVLPCMGDDLKPYVFNNVELILRSMICSLDMFMLDVDGNILDNLQSPLLKGLILIQATFSFVCTITLLASLIFSRMKAYYLLHRKTRITKEKNHLYLFFGIDENSRLLAKDVAAHDDKAVIVFVDNAVVSEDENDSWDNIVNLFTHRQKTFDIAEDAKALVAISSSHLCDLEEEWLAVGKPDVFAMIGIDKIRDLIRELIRFPDESQLHLFFLSEDEDRNIHSLLNLAKDATMLSVAADKGIQHHIYCHARYNGPNRVVEDLAVRRHLNVEIIDSSHLAVELMKSTPEDQPVRTAWLSGKYPSMVERPLECLIVGFGEVGRDSFRFIYEFGTFMQMKDGRPCEAKPRITAVDSKMKYIEGLFRIHKPAVDFDKVPGQFTLLDLDWHEEAFFSGCLSPMQCRNLNYIVIALGDDDQNISLAINMFNLIRTHRKDMTHLVIMVRCVRYENMEMMRKVADHYNQGARSGHDVIRLFGNPKQLYSYRTVIKDDLTEKGKAFYYNYARLRGEDADWDKRQRKLTQIEISPDGEPGYPNLDNLRKLRRQESQDMANALHASTKTWLLRSALGEDVDWYDFRSRYFDCRGVPDKMGSYAGIRYPGLSDKENEIILNLAMLEHARWNSAHELLGYRVNKAGHGCDERTRLHNCLRPWEELDDESHLASSADWQCDYKAYDFSVVDTSISLM